MFLLPWFFMYGVSALPFAHGKFFEGLFGKTEYTVIADHPYDLGVHAADEPREIGARLLDELGLEKTAYYIDASNPERIRLYRWDFRSSDRIFYFVSEKRLLAEKSSYPFHNFLTGMHARGGFMQEGLLHDAWGVVVDIVCVAMLIWITTGIYMWWLVPKTRMWGALILIAGMASFAWFLLAL
jgi:hypothetical protein